MAQKTLTTSYLAQLTNANHDGVTQQIDDRLQGHRRGHPQGLRHPLFPITTSAYISVVWTLVSYLDLNSFTSGRETLLPFV